MVNETTFEQLKRTHTVSYFTPEGDRVDLASLKGGEKIVVRQKGQSEKTGLILFTFEDYMINPFTGFDFNEKFNKGRNIPLKIMQGKIEKTVGKMYYISARGYHEPVGYCQHCLCPLPDGCLCEKCFKALHVCGVEDVTWSGYVPIKSCKRMEEI